MIEKSVIEIIVINYKKSDLAIGFCRSLAKLKGHEKVHVLIVDNAADDQSRLALGGLKIAGLEIEVLHEKENWGYFGGARRGLEFLRLKTNEISGNQKLPKWIIISNSDIEFSDPSFIENLEAKSPDNDVALIGPKILSALSGANQNPYMIVRPTGAQMHFYKWVFRFLISCFAYQMLGLVKSLVKNLFFNKIRKSLDRVASDIKAQDIYGAHGAFLIFSREYIEKGGNFDHQPFLFGEEVTIAENCRRLQMRVRYEPDLVVSHIEHATIGIFPSRNMLKFQREASAYCADTYFS